MLNGYINSERIGFNTKGKLIFWVKMEEKQIRIGDKKNRLLLNVEAEKQKIEKQQEAKHLDSNE